MLHVQQQGWGVLCVAGRGWARVLLRLCSCCLVGEAYLSQVVEVLPSLLRVSGGALAQGFDAALLGAVARGEGCRGKDLLRGVVGVRRTLCVRTRVGAVCGSTAVAGLQPTHMPGRFDLPVCYVLLTCLCLCGACIAGHSRPGCVSPLSTCIVNAFC